MADREYVCYYCGEKAYGTPRRRKDCEQFHPMHRECATKWDNEAKRL